MRPIIIGAGRGKRLKAMTDHQPKCFTEVAGRPILDWTLHAFRTAGLADPVFIGGYLIDTLRAHYPDLTYCHNTEWPDNNILASLFYAEEYMSGGFLCSYSDILFRDTVVLRALEELYEPLKVVAAGTP